MNIGRWRLRGGVVRCRRSGLFWDRHQYPEGTIYRLRLGLWMVKVLVDCLSERERTLARYRADAFMTEFKSHP